MSVHARVFADVHYAWYGPSLLITTVSGWCDESHHLTGYYFREARHLSTLRLELNGTKPWLCADAVSSQRQLDCVFVYPELTRFGGGGTDVSDDTTWVDADGARPGDPPGAVWALASIDVQSTKGGVKGVENQDLGPALDKHGNIPPETPPPK